MRGAGLALMLALSAMLSACAAGALDLVTPRGGYSRVADIAYGPLDRQRLDLYVPDGATGETPLAVFIHGGSWDSGSKDIYRFLGQSLTAEGFIVAVPNYRLSPQTVFPGFVEDAARALASVDRALATGAHGVPGGRRPVMLVGHSAGAQIAALLAFDRRYLEGVGTTRGRLSAFVGLAGPYDFLPLEEERYRRVFPQATRPESQPVRFADGAGPRTLLVHGLADRTVNPENSRSMARAIATAGGAVELDLVAGADHLTPVTSFSTVVPLGDRRIRTRVVEFLKEQR